MLEVALKAQIGLHFTIWVFRSWLRLLFDMIWVLHNISNSKFKLSKIIRFVCLRKWKMHQYFLHKSHLYWTSVVNLVSFSFYVKHLGYPITRPKKGKYPNWVFSFFLPEWFRIWTMSQQSLTDKSCLSDHFNCFKDRVLKKITDEVQFFWEGHKDLVQSSSWFLHYYK